MPARTGKQYLTGLKEQEREVWLGGERVRDVTTHKGLAGGARAVAHLYDMQHDPALREVMTFPSPSTGEPVGRSFDMPRTKEALETRSKMMLNWARATCGMMGRSPDFMNVTFAAWGAAADFFGEKRPEFADNMRRYVEFIRENDVTLTHSLINLQRSRNPPACSTSRKAPPSRSRRRPAPASSCRAPGSSRRSGRLSDEIAVYSPRLARHSEEHSPFAVNFSIPCSTPGLKFLCRDSFDLGRSHFDHPLGSRFEEMDCVVFFDDVLVPWERVFLLYDVERLNQTPHVTHSTAHSAHQGAAKNLAKCEFVLGIALLHDAGARQRPPAAYRGADRRVDALYRADALLHARRRGRCRDRPLGRHVPVDPAGRKHRNLMMTCYPRMIEILHLLGSSSFLIQPSEADFQGPLRADIEQYLATDNSAPRTGSNCSAWPGTSPATPSAAAKSCNAFLPATP